MKPVERSHPYSRAEIIAEKFIPDHVFIYVAAGKLKCFDAAQSYTFNKGECFIARKNRLAKYKVENSEDGFEPIAFCLDEAFLKAYQAKHQLTLKAFASKATFIKVTAKSLLSSFIHSITPYYIAPYTIDKYFEDVKYEELLLILLKQQPELADLLFDFGIPEKIDLEEFMHKNFTFNVSLGRFAFLTGRSISAFKRDFFTTFNDTPGHWLIQRRLEEAYFLLDHKGQRPSNFYLDLGFESLTHFSAAFKKQFGLAPTKIIEQRKIRVQK